MSEAERLFTEWLVRRPVGARTGEHRVPSAAGQRPPDAAAHPGSEADDPLAALCAAHPEHAAALRVVHADYFRIARILQSVGGSFPAVSEGGAAACLVLAERIVALDGPGTDRNAALQPQDVLDTSSGFPSEVLSRLTARPDTSGRYSVEGELARGGQGVILSVWDEDLRRSLAMKVTLGAVSPPQQHAADAARPAASDAGSPSVNARSVGRFLEEAQVTSQLDHPGIVPVHELGLDRQGRVFFTMKLVKGEDLKAVFERVHAGEAGWSQTHALSLLLRVAEAMSYAHSKRVIHRDLKPSNIMVGRYGEVYVMDWGLARVLDRKDDKDVRVRPQAALRSVDLTSERREQAASDPGSPLFTMDGDVVGTPAYMSPEQASGRLESMGPPSDVYALGATLYHLLTARIPYVAPHGTVDNYAVLTSVQEGPPAPVTSLAPQTPAELVAICEKAMARDPASRYRDMSAFAEDLRAYLERRVVAAYETGAVAELRKWIVRNKPLAAALAAGVLLLAAGLTASLLLKAASDRNARLAVAEGLVAREHERIATQKTGDVLSLSAIQELEELVARAADLWPAEPQLLPAYELWLAEARVLIEGAPADPARGLAARPGLREHESKLAEIRQRALPLEPAQAEPAGLVADGEREVPERRSYEFTDPQDRWWHHQLADLLMELTAFTDEETGLFSMGTSAQHGWGIPRRAAFARGIDELTVSGPDAARRWSEATEGVAQSPRYAGWKLPIQSGLLPIGVDPDSGLWEFWHVPSGDEPQRDEHGRLVPSEEMGIVLVLIPGGSFLMGAQNTDPAGGNHDLLAGNNEAPVHPVQLSPYLLSKYELTQGQWARFTGSNPSQYVAGSQFGARRATLLNPVEQVSWDDAMLVLPRLGLTLPTEAQWERAARSGTATAWSSGSERESLRGVANLADQAAARAGATWSAIKDWPELDDGWSVHSPVGSFRANPFGLHDVHGNVWELCLDSYDADFYGRSPPLDPQRESPLHHNRIIRGGSYYSDAVTVRSANRDGNMPQFRDYTVGLRPAKLIKP